MSDLPMTDEDLDTLVQMLSRRHPNTPRGRAAIAITALRAEIARLGNEAGWFAAATCPHFYGDKYGNQRCSEIDRLQAEIERLKAYPRHTDDMNDLVLMGLARDEAYAEVQTLRAEIARLTRERDAAEAAALERAAALREALVMALTYVRDNGASSEREAILSRGQAALAKLDGGKP